MATTAAAGDLQLSSEISRTAIAFEDKNTLIVRLTWAGEPFLYTLDDFPLPTLEKLEILGSSTSVSSNVDSTVEAGEITTRTFRYILQPVDYGTGVINPLNVKAKNRLTEEVVELQTGRLTMEIAAPVARPKDKESSNVVLFIVIAAVLVIGGGGAYVFLRKKGRPSDEIPEDRIYVDKLDSIKKETVADSKLFYSRIYRLLLLYLENEKGLNLSGKTGDEVLEAVNELGDDAERASLIKWLTTAQKVKYQPAAPSAGDVDGMYTTLAQFFESNKPR